MKLVVQLITTIFILTACSGEIVEIESNNEYAWQKYMNEEEFNEIKEGMTYIEVVRVVGGEGEKVEAGIYEWPDEQIMTKAYELKFKEDKLVEKKIVEKRGNSSR